MDRFLYSIYDLFVTNGFLLRSSLEFNSSIWIVVAHFMYYTFAYFWSILKTESMVVPKFKHKEISRLRSKYGVIIKIFDNPKKRNHHGVSVGNKIYLNASLFNKKVRGSDDQYSAVRRTFHHEHYHIMKMHKEKKLLLRFALSVLPLLLWTSHWSVFVVLYVLMLIIIREIENMFEQLADDYSDTVTYKHIL